MITTVNPSGKPGEAQTRSTLPLRFANGFANRRHDGLGCDGLGEDVSDYGSMLAQHVGVGAQGHSWVGVAKPSGHAAGRGCCDNGPGRDHDGTRPRTTPRAAELSHI
jgi:hypothetical protein